MLEIKEIKYIEDYTLWLLFSDGTDGNVDLKSSVWGPAFEPLKEVVFFKKAYISPVSRTVTRPKDVDFAPEYLKDKLIEQTAVMQASEDNAAYSAGR
ncbi:MAG: DUF2442 domain-containing protein [Kiritimatiellae bacterium]|jgi:hypothetical protein|nr:DUF2442 domain-containing protein [Kiritimatiellia bacterium]